MHYAVLRPRPREGAAIPASLALETGGSWQEALAWQYAVSYGQRANAAASRDMATSRNYHAEDVPAYVAFRQGKGVLASIKRHFDTYSCAREYADARITGKSIRFAEGMRERGSFPRSGSRSLEQL